MSEAKRKKIDIAFLTDSVEFDANLRTAGHSTVINMPVATLQYLKLEKGSEVHVTIRKKGRDGKRCS